MRNWVKHRDIQDIPRISGGMMRLLPWILGLLVFIMCLVLAGALFVGTSLQRWDVGSMQRLTVEVPVSSPEKRDAMTTSIMTRLGELPEVGRIEVISVESMQGLLSPLLSAVSHDVKQHLPILIDVILPQTQDAESRLQYALTQALPGLLFDVHVHDMSRLRLVSMSLQSIAYAFTAAILLSVGAMIALVTKVGLAVHHNNISILQSLGASVSYITGRFQRHVLRLSIQGGVMGGLLSLPVIATFSWLLTLFGIFPPSVFSTGWLIALGGILGLMILTICLSLLVAKMTVMKTLSRLEMQKLRYG